MLRCTKLKCMAFGKKPFLPGVSDGGELMRRYGASGPTFDCSLPVHSVQIRLMNWAPKQKWVIVASSITPYRKINYPPLRNGVQKSTAGRNMLLGTTLCLRVIRDHLKPKIDLKAGLMAI